MTTPYERVCSYFDVDARRDSHNVCCPHHQDNRASLSIGRGKNDTALITCQVGCQLADIVQTMGLTMSDLFPHNGNGNGTGRHIVSTYDYKDEAGTLLFQKVRYEPKDFRQRRPDGAGDWLWSLGDTRRVLYRLPDLIAADKSTLVFLVEGEKDADNLAKWGLVATCNVEGASKDDQKPKWRSDYTPYFEGHPVVILPDNDSAGQAHMINAARQIKPGAASIKMINLPGLAPKGDFTDWRNIGGTIDQLMALIDAAPEWEPPAAVAEPSAAPPSEPTDEERGDLPTIQTNGRNPKHISEDAYQALLAANDPATVFVRAGELTRIVADENDRPTAKTITADSLTFVLHRAANFFTRRYNKSQRDWVETPGPIQHAIVKDVLAYPAWPDIPGLLGIVTAPTFAPGGELSTAAGYNPATRLYYHDNGLKIGDIEPTAANVTAARNIIIHNLLVDFPFKDAASTAHALAVLLQPFVRAMIPGSTPLYLTDAPTQGTGKGLLNKVLTIPFAPEGTAVMTAPTDPEEWCKKITSTLLEAPSHVLIDNIKGRVDSADLEAVLTNESWKDRFLGTMDNVTVPVQCTWLATANNAEFSPDLVRRTVWIRLDAGMERPDTRPVSDFIHPDLTGWAKANRDDLVTAALTLINRWVADGMPAGSQTKGGYETWAKTMGGILGSIGVPGFLDNDIEMYERLNTVRAPWAAFVSAWWDKHQSHEVGTSELYPLASAYDSTGSLPVDCLDLLGGELDGHNERARKTQLGLLLRKNESQIFEGCKIIAIKKKQGAARYRLERPENKLV